MLLLCRCICLRRFSHLTSRVVSFMDSCFDSILFLLLPALAEFVRVTRGCAAMETSSCSLPMKSDNGGGRGTPRLCSLPLLAMSCTMVSLKRTM